jgi:hypothetical protein
LRNLISCMSVDTVGVDLRSHNENVGDDKHRVMFEPWALAAQRKEKEYYYL